MRRPTLYIVVAAVATAALAGALYSYDTEEPSPASEGTVTHDYKPMTAATVSNGTVTIPEDIAASNNAFAVKFYRQLSGDDNIFFSPASMYTAFSILYEGAREDSASQLEDTFGFETGAQDRHNATAHMMASINRESPDFELNIANALWIGVGTILEEYVQITRETYLADIEIVSFLERGDDGKKIAVKKINQWASNNTNGKIDEVVNEGDIPDITVMVINNAVYFNGTWVTQFPKNDTREADFWTNGTQSVQTDFMNVRGMFDYVSHDDAQILRMPYKGDRLSMLVILPDNIEDLGQSLSSEQIALWRQSLVNQEVIVSVPTFEFKTNYQLNGILDSMGVRDIFSKDFANLTGIIPRDLQNQNLYVFKALHDAYVDVNEEGTEAAAVTTIIFADESATSPPPKFTANKPFVFLIQDDESGTILFMGQVSDPTK